MKLLMTDDEKEEKMSRLGHGNMDYLLQGWEQADSSREMLHSVTARLLGHQSAGEERNMSGGLLLETEDCWIATSHGRHDSLTKQAIKKITVLCQSSVTNVGSEM